MEYCPTAETAVFDRFSSEICLSLPEIPYLGVKY